MKTESGMEILPAVQELAKELKVPERSGHILFPYVLELMQLAYRDGHILGRQEVCRELQAEATQKTIIH